METIPDVQLLNAPEPIALKTQAVQQRYQDPGWDSDSLRAWYGNELPSYLWTECGWGSFLKHQGLTWQEFLECLSAWRDDICQWLRNELSWEELIADIKQTVARFKPWLDARHGHGFRHYFPLRTR